MDDDWGRGWVHFYSGAIAEKEFIGILLLNVPIRFEEIVIVIICLFISAEWS